MSADHVVIGEGVALDVRSASPLVLALGWLIDLVVTVTLFMALTAVVVGRLTAALDVAAARGISIVTTVLIIVIIPTAVETLSRGRSLGKLAVGVRIVRDDGGPIRLRHALVRALVGSVELWATLGVLAFIVSIANARGKRLGDLLAGTYPARVRGGEKPLPPLFMPPQLASWAQIADIRPLPDGMALAARQFVGRAPTLTPAARTQLGGEYSARLAQYVSPPPPAGTPDEAYIAAVLATRRDREYVIGQGTEHRTEALRQQLARLPHGVA